MNYFNKFQDLVTKGVNNVKNAVMKDSSSSSFTNPYVQRGMTSMSSVDPNVNQQQTQKQATSLSAFLMGGPDKGNQTQGSTSSSSSSSTMNNPYTMNNNFQNANDVDLATISFESYQKKGMKPDADFLKDFQLLPGETPLQWERCEIHLDNQDFSCRALITGFRLYMIPLFTSKNLLESFNIMGYRTLFPENYFSIPIYHIVSCTKELDKIKSGRYVVVIVTNDARKFNLVFSIGQNDAFYFCLSGLMNLKKSAQHHNFARTYCEERKKKKPFSPSEDGWNIYNAEMEYARQGLTNLSTEYTQNKDVILRRTLLNENYNLCNTYPKYLITSAKIMDQELKLGAMYRTKNRLPCLSYYYYKNKGSVWRCSQNKSGITGNRNEYDEKLLGCISQVGSDKNLCLFDARPYLSAYANKLKGAGFENVENYSNTQIFFCDIANIHDARNAIKKIYTMTTSPNFSENKKFYGEFNSTTWPEFIYLLIKSSMLIAQNVKSGRSTLIHCSDGWDRASQLTAFSQMLIDPYYRTIRGYITLIEKYFVSFGHQFRYRNGYFTSKEAHEDQNSPIFLQYLDATHQLLVQYPMYFEFNMDFLLFIANNISNGLYGTFLYNHEHERDVQEARTKTVSIWTDVLLNMDKYKNPFYNTKTAKEYFFIPNFSSHKIRLWEEFFLQNIQLGLGLTYHKVVTRWDDKDKQNVYNKRVISQAMFTEKIKEEFIAEQKQKDEEIKRLQSCLMEIMNKQNVNVDELGEEAQKVIKDIKEKKETNEVKEDVQEGNNEVEGNDIVPGNIGNLDEGNKEEKEEEKKEELQEIPEGVTHIEEEKMD